MPLVSRIDVYLVVGVESTPYRMFPPSSRFPSLGGALGCPCLQSLLQFFETGGPCAILATIGSGSATSTMGGSVCLKSRSLKDDVGSGGGFASEPLYRD